MIFVGYSDAQKAWKCYDPNTKTVVCSTNVRFDNESIPANGQKTDIPFIMDMLTPSSPNTEVASDNLPSHTSLEINPSPEVSPTRMDQPINQIPIDIESDVDTLPSTEDNDTISICSFDTVDSLPSEINATLSLLLVHENDNAPLYEDAIKGVHKAQWLKAIAKEYASLKLNKVLSETSSIRVNQAQKHCSFGYEGLSYGKL